MDHPYLLDPVLNILKTSNIFKTKMVSSFFFFLCLTCPCHELLGHVEPFAVSYMRHSFYQMHFEIVDL